MKLLHVTLDGTSSFFTLHQAVLYMKLLQVTLDGICSFLKLHEVVRACSAALYAI